MLLSRLQQIIETEALMKFTGGDEDIIQKMVKGYIEKYPILVNEFKTVQLEQDLAEISEILHRMKPTIYLFSTQESKRLFDQCYEVFDEQVFIQLQALCEEIYQQLLQL